MRKKRSALIEEENLVSKIYFIRNQKVMVDRDLAELYRVETKVLKQAVRRNLARFPGDFMFQMTATELKNWRLQIVTSNLADNMGLRYAPFCFTEQGVTMLSCILNSKRAIQVNIRVIRIFAQFRETLLSNKEILVKLEKMEKDLSNTNRDVAIIFQTLKSLLEKPVIPERLPMPPDRVRIGYKARARRS